MIITASIIAALFGGGALLWNRKKKPAGAEPLSAMEIDEFLERRSDGLVQYKRETAKQILGWLSSVTLEPLEDVGSAHAYSLISSATGAPPPEGAAASRELVNAAFDGNVVLAHRGLTHTGRERRAVVVPPGSRELGELAGEKGAYAILIVPNDEPIAPSLPAMPGFSPERKPVPGAPAGEKTAGAGSSRKMPPSLAAKVDDLLKKPDSKPEALIAISKQLRLGGYEAEAEDVEKRALDLRARAVAAVARAPSSFVIPPNHPGAMALAKKLAGDPKRYRELLRTNPGLTDRGGFVVPWAAGQVILLPASWVSRRRA